MWIFCCGMIRAGSTLQYQVVAHLVEKAGLGRRAGYFTRESFSDFFHTVKTEDGWNVVKMHDYFELVRLLLAEDKARAFYSFRDIRDVAVSSMRKFGMSFEELMEKEWLNHAIATGEKWRSCSNILVSKYEDLVRNPGREFCRMARHIGIELSEEYRDHLVGEYSLERQRQRIEELNRENLVVQDEMLYDDFSQLHVDHIHKGEIGGWKNILSHREAEILSLRYRDWLCENGYAVQFNKMETTYVPHAGWFEHEPDDEVARLVREGHFEGFEQAFWWLYLRDKDIVLDVGAHWGLYSVLASRATGGCGRIYAFEPNAGTIPVLKKNIDANTTGEITVLDCACSSREGRACFNLLDSGYSSHSYLSDSRADSGNCVETVTVDSLMEREGIEKADLVKIDVEGHELEVLRGSAGSIREKRLPLLMVEFNEHNLNRSGKTTLDLYSELRDLGYHVCRFDIYSMALKPVRVAEQISYENLFACLDPEQVNGRLEGAPENRRRIALDLIEKARATDRIKELQHLETYKKKAELTEAFRVWAETAQGALETEKARCLELKSWAEKAQAAFEQERETSGQLRQRIHDLQAALEEHQSISVEMKAWANKDQGDYEDAVELNRKYLSRIRDLEKQAGRLKQNQRVLLKGLEDMERRSVDLAAGIRDTGLLALVRNRVFNRGFFECRSVSMDSRISAVEVCDNIDSRKSPLLSVVLCTYDPDMKLLRRALKCLSCQTIGSDLWEFILVDNNSAVPLGKNVLEGFGIRSYRIVREIRPGLISSRLCGLGYASAPLLVLVDDDNFLSEDYLKNAHAIAEKNPDIGAFGGISEPEYEEPPLPWTEPLLGHLAIRNYGDEVITSTRPEWGKWDPVGAGMVVRRDVLEKFAEKICLLTAHTLGRRRNTLSGGEDTLIARCANELGYACSYQPSLKLVHYIKKERVSVRYLRRLIYWQGRTFVRLLKVQNKPVSRPDDMPLLQYFRRHRRYKTDSMGAAGKLQAYWDLGYYVEAQLT